MKIEYKSNLYGGLVSLIFGVLLFLIIPHQIAPDLIDMGTITSRTMPYIISVVFYIMWYKSVGTKHHIQER